MIVLPFAIASDGNASAASGAGADRAWLKLHTAAARPPAYVLRHFVAFPI